MLCVTFGRAMANALTSPIPLPVSQRISRFQTRHYVDAVTNLTHRLLPSIQINTSLLSIEPLDDTTCVAHDCSMLIDQDSRFGVHPQDRYSEKLVFINGPLSMLSPPTIPESTNLTREVFGFPSTDTGKVTIGVMAEAFKLHPRFDWVLRVIMHREPTAVLVLISGSQRRWTQILLRRLQIHPDRLLVHCWCYVCFCL
jgi:hypothetical protein